MESSEGLPVEEKEEEHIPEEEREQIDRFQNRQDFLDFLDEFKELRLKDNDKKEEENLDSLSIDTLKLKTIATLRKIRDEEYPSRLEKYSSDDEEVEKINNNKNKYLQYESENEDVRIFIDISRNIDQLEKNIFTEDGMEAMYIFKDEEPRAKILREKLKELFKGNKSMFFLGTFVIAFSSVIVSIEEGLRQLQKRVKKEMYKKYLQAKDEIKTRVKKEIKKNVDEANKNIKKQVLELSQKKVEQVFLNLVDNILHDVLKYLFSLLVFFVVSSLLYYKYG